MPQVVVTIDGKTYRMACAEGEEEHLAGLAAELDQRVAQLRAGFGEIGDLRLMVMAAIMTADELAESRRCMREREEEARAARAERDAALRRASSGEAALAGHLLGAAEAIDRIRAKLEQRS